MGDNRINKVMKEVASIEEKKIFKQLLWIVPCLVGGLVIAFIYGSRVWEGLSNLGLSEFFSSFIDDFDLAKKSLGENVSLIWDLMPRSSLYIAVLTVTVLLAIIVLNRNFLSSIRRRMTSIAKYKQERR